MEQLLSVETMQDVMNPWWMMYQPVRTARACVLRRAAGVMTGGGPQVSYRLQGRMGTRDDLRTMIATCRGMNVRVYADAVINHMTGGGNDASLTHRDGTAACNTWTMKNTSAGAPSPFYNQDYQYIANVNTNLPPSQVCACTSSTGRSCLVHGAHAPRQEYPGVPYGPTDFHCERPLNSWTDPLDLNAGWLTGLVDLNTERDNVQQRIADYLTDMLGIGFSGARVRALPWRPCCAKWQP